MEQEQNNKISRIRLFVLEVIGVIVLPFLVEVITEIKNIK